MHPTNSLWPTPSRPLAGDGLGIVGGPSLYARLCRRETLDQAGWFVLAHPPEIAVEDLSLAELRDFRAEFLGRLQWELQGEAYQPAAVIRLCRIQRRSPPDCVRLLTARDRVVCVALLDVLAPVLVAAPAAVLPIGVIRGLLERGYYRLRPDGQGGGLSPEELWALLREFGAQIRDEPIRRLIKRLMRAQLSDQIRLAS